jgi:hypothetical protein
MWLQFKGLLRVSSETKYFPKRNGEREVYSPKGDKQQYMQQGQASWKWSMDMQQGHVARTCSMELQHGYSAWTFSMDMQDGHVAWTCTVAWICSRYMHHGHAAWT